MIIWVLIFIPIVSLIIYFKQINKYWENKNVPSVKPWLFVGNMGNLIFRKQDSCEVVQQIYKSHDTRYIGLHFFLKPFLMIKDLDLIKQITIKEFDHFTDHRQSFDPEIEPIFSKNLFSLKGEKWRNMRSTLSPAFTGSKMRTMFVLMSDCAEQFANYFTEIVNPDEPLTLELKDSFSRFANDIIASTAFGIQCNSMKDKQNEFYLMGKDIMNFGGWRLLKFFAYQVVPWIMKSLRVNVFPQKAIAFFCDIIRGNIKSREEQGIVRPDMIHLLIEARKGKLKHEEKVIDEGAGFATVEESHVGKQIVQQGIITDDDIAAQALIFFLAGFDTVSNSICHIVYELTLNEDIQERLQQEIDTTLEECKGKLSYDALIKMKYLDMVISEGMRKWPALPAVDRVCTNTFTIQPENPGEVSVTLKKGDAIWIPAFALHRNPEYYPNPGKFDPERFNDENKANIVPFTYMPFGIGPRNCIGSRFALLEMKTLLFHMLSKFSFVVVEKTEIPLKLSRKQFISTAANGFWVGLKTRNK